MKKEVLITRRKRVLSIFLTLIIISVLILSGPALAITVGLQQVSSQNGIYQYQAIVDLHTPDHVKMDFVAVRLTNQNESSVSTCYFHFNNYTLDSQFTSQSDSACSMVNITNVVINASYVNTSGFGYGYGYGSNYSWNISNVSWNGYGYQYTAGVGEDSFIESSPSDGEIIINFTINTTIQGGPDSGIVFGIEAGVAGTESNQIKYTYYNKVSAETFIVFVEDTYPNIVVTSPINNYNSSFSDITFNFTATDNLDTNLTCNLSIDGMVNLSNITVQNATPQVNISTGVNDGTYSWNVSCWNSQGNISTSNTRQFTVDTIFPSTAPRVISVSDSDLDGNINIAWSIDSNAARYGIFRASSNVTNASQAVRLENISGLNFIDNTSRSGVEYWYAVTTIDYTGNENLSIINTSTGTFVNATASDSIVPNLPVGITVKNSTTIATISWPAVLYDIGGNPDFSGLMNEVWMNSGGILNESLNITENGFGKISGINSSTNSTTWSIPSSCESPCNFMFIVTTVDDGGNTNLTQDLATYSLNLANVTLTYVEPSSSSDSSDSSGGGGGITITKKEDVFSRGWSSIEGTLDISIEKELIPITNVKVSFAEKAFNFQFDIKALSDFPDFLPKLKYESYSILRITAKSMEGHTFIRPTIEFKVKNSWLAKNYVDSKDIALYRYRNGSWYNLKTTHTKKDDTYSYYSARTPDFSYFAIVPTLVSKPLESIGTQDDLTDNFDDSQVDLSSGEEVTGNTFLDESDNDDMGSIWGLIGFIFGIILVVGIVIGGTLYFMTFKGEVDKVERLQQLESQSIFPPRLVNYINASIIRKIPKEKIKTDLIKNGWSKEIVESAIAFVKN